MFIKSLKWDIAFIVNALACSWGIVTLSFVSAETKHTVMYLTVVCSHGYSIVPMGFLEALLVVFFWAAAP